MSAGIESTLWRRRARFLALRLNFALWLERVVPVWVGLFFLLALAILWERGRGGDSLRVAAVVTGLFVLTGLVQGFRARASFFRVADALDYLDERLHLHNRLGAADAGVGAWPPFPAPFPSVARYRLDRGVSALLAALLLVAVAAQVPITRSRTAPSPTAGPLAWQEMEQALEALREERVVREEALDDFEARLDDLRSQPKEEWFRHGSLEASDTLKEELRSEMRELMRGLERAESSVAALAELDEHAPPEERRLRQRTLGAAIDELELGGLPLERELTRELHTLARGGKVRRATQEEIAKWKELRERLYQGLPGGKDGVVVAVARSRNRGTDSGAAGRGGVTRGPGSAPIQLSDERTELGTKSIDTVRSEDPSGGLPGETLGFTVGEHEVDTSRYRGGYDAGSVVSRGQGGELVWSSSLTPRERRVLQKYFQ